MQPKDKETPMFEEQEPSAEKVDGGHLLTDCGGFVQFVPDQASGFCPGNILGFGMDDDDEAA